MRKYAPPYKNRVKKRSLPATHSPKALLSLPLRPSVRDFSGSFRIFPDLSRSSAPLPPGGLQAGPLSKTPIHPHLDSRQHASRMDTTFVALDIAFADFRGLRVEPFRNSNPTCWSEPHRNRQASIFLSQSFCHRHPSRNSPRPPFLCALCVALLSSASPEAAKRSGQYTKAGLILFLVCGSLFATVLKTRKD